ncbi:unnamed protein product [Peniophora sp. CBMAI 1063]|nr:unnamed protein product [Peniophora sp. CBMAI 1063]
MTMPLPPPPTTRVVSLKKAPGSKSTAATLRSLYPRAARAFLHRDIALTHSLITSALVLLSSAQPGSDALAEHRRKWDILRLTLEVTVYTAPPEDSASIPAPLRSNAMLSGASLISTLHARSVQFFTPYDVASHDAAYLPGPVVVTLATASVKINAPAIGRNIVEEWLARRSHVISSQAPGDEGYDKVLEVYCTSILPALDEWEYAAEFLHYETEMDPETKQRLVLSLSALHARHIAAQEAARNAASASTSAPSSPSASFSPSASRPLSPSSSSSSLSTTSTHTAVPATPKGRGSISTNGLTPLSPVPRKPQDASNVPSAATSRTVTPVSSAKRVARPPSFRVPSTSNGHANMNGAPTQLVPAQTTSPPGMIALLRTAIRPYLAHGLSLSHLAAALAVVLIPLLSLVFRLRRRSSSATPSAAAVSDVRRRLGQGQARAGVFRTLWEESLRAVVDTVRMGGRGLV